MELFKAHLAKKFNYQKPRETFSNLSLWKDSDSFMREYPVIMSTTHSLRSCINPKHIFDSVIMDEASQIDVVTGSLALSCARSSVIVGDLMQLPNVVSDRTRNEVDQLFKKTQLPEAYNFSEYNILSSVIKLFPHVPKTLLQEHYRCHPKIIGFCNQKFYNNELIILTEEDESNIKPLQVYKTAKGNHARGRYNQRQIDVILHEILPEYINKKQTICLAIQGSHQQAHRILR